MRTGENDESIEELAKDAAAAEATLEQTTVDDPGAPPTKPAHRIR